MGFLSKKDILEAEDVYFVIEEVPEWGGKVRIASLSLEDRLELEEIQNTPKEDDKGLNMDALLFVLSRCLQDESGDILFSDQEIDKLLSKSARVVYRLFSKCMEVNKVDIADKGTSSSKNLKTVHSQDSLID